MWSLVYVGNALHKPAGASRNIEAEIHLLCGKDYVVGRKNVDILLAEDPSISRKHAVLSVKHEEKNLNKPACLPVLSVADYSKFGTFVGGNKLSGGTRTLSDGEQIKFGQLQSVYRVQYKPLRVTASFLSGADKVQLKQYLIQLGGHQVNEATGDLDILVMGKVGVTVKAVCALATLKPVVTMEYFVSLLTAIESKTSLPSTDSFTPVMSEEGADKDLLKPKQQRPTLFIGKTFFFCSRSQFERMKVAVELAGGTALLLESKPRSLSQLTAAGCILMYCDTGSQPPWYKDCSTYLTRKHKRYIQDAEIGHAVLYCSTQKHCNPEQDAGSRLHEEFSQKLSNTQCMSQAADCTKQSQLTMPAPTLPNNTSTSCLVADSQCSRSSRAAERSTHVADMLPPPDVTSVAETQKSLQQTTSASLKTEPRTPSTKRTSDTDTYKHSKRARVSADPSVSTQTASTSQETQDTQQRMDRSNCNFSIKEDSTVPSMRDVDTPTKGTEAFSALEESAECDMSVVEETQSSGSSNKPPNDVQVPVKTEAIDRLASLDAVPHAPTNDDLSEERKVEIGESWDRIQVDYGSLLRRSKPPVFENNELPERQGMALWKGKWVPNFKRFKKCGRKNVARLPTIIGGGDLVDGLCSQTDSQDDFISMPEEVVTRPAEVIAPQLAPKRTTIKSSIFGGQWELPSKK